MAKNNTAAAGAAEKNTKNTKQTNKKTSKTKSKKTTAKPAAKKEQVETIKEEKPQKELSPIAFEAICILAVGLAILILFSLFFAPDTVFGEVVLAVLKGFFGVGAYILPFAVILGVIGLYLHGDRESVKFKTVLICMLYVVVVSILHILVSEPGAPFVPRELLQGFTDTDYIGGGLVGGFIGGISLVLFKRTGSLIIFLTLMAALIVLISGKSAFRIASNLVAFLGDILKGGFYREKRDRYDDYYDYDDYDDYDDYYDYDDEYYEEYEEPEPASRRRERTASKDTKQKPTVIDVKSNNSPRLSDNTGREAIKKRREPAEAAREMENMPEESEESYYDKLRREKGYRSAEVIDIKERSGQRKERPDIMIKRVRNTSLNKPYKPEKRTRMPEFMKNREEERNNPSEYIPAFLDRGKEEEREERGRIPQIRFSNDNTYRPEPVKPSSEDKYRPESEFFDDSKGSDSLITVEPVYDEDVYDVYEDREETVLSDRENAETTEVSDEATGKAVNEKAKNNDKPISEDVPPWEEHKEEKSVPDEVKNRVKVVEGDDKTVKRLPSGNSKKYSFPKLSFLDKNPNTKGPNSRDELLRNSHILEETLRSFKIDATVVEVSQGPTVTRYELVPAVGTKVKSIANLDKDLAMRLAAENIIIEAPIPGKTAVGIEIPNENPSTVYFSEVVASKKFQMSKSKLTFALGKDVAGNVIVRDIAKAPHFLIAGATNSGKSVCINTLINCILFKASPDEVRLIMVDPKMVELNVYNGIPHLLLPVVTDPTKAAAALNWACTEMMHRYKLCADVGVRNLDEYNEYLKKNSEKPLYKIVIIIDELADLMLVAKKEVEGHIQRLTQLARAAGIHLIVATQRPSSDVITGVIKSNIPSRIAFSVAQSINSRIILDESGAEKLIGKGDMLLKTIEMDRVLRVQGAFINNDEIKRVVDHIKTDTPNYDQEIIRSIENPETVDGGGFGNIQDKGQDELIDDVIAYVVKSRKASTSLIQRQFQIGYNRAARIIDDLEDRGIIGPENGSKPRVVLMDKEEWSEYSQRHRDYI